MKILPGNIIQMNLEQEKKDIMKIVIFTTFSAIMKLTHWPWMLWTSVRWWLCWHDYRIQLIIISRYNFSHNLYNIKEIFFLVKSNVMNNSVNDDQSEKKIDDDGWWKLMMTMMSNKTGKIQSLVIMFHHDHCDQLICQRKRKKKFFKYRW